MMTPMLSGSGAPMIPIIPMMNIQTMALMNSMKMNGMNNDCIIMVDTCATDMNNMATTMQW